MSNICGTLVLITIELHFFFYQTYIFQGRSFKMWQLFLLTKFVNFTLSDRLFKVPMFIVKTELRTAFIFVNHNWCSVYECLIVLN